MLAGACSIWLPCRMSSRPFWGARWIWWSARPSSRAKTTFGARVFYKTRRSFMRRDDAYLLDILIAAHKALAFVADMTWEAFEISELHQNAVIRTLETIGEAARLVSQPTRDAHPEIPWEQMIGMRHRL